MRDSISESFKAVKREEGTARFVGGDAEMLRSC